MQTEDDLSTHDLLRTACRAQWMAGIALFLVLLGFGLGWLFTLLMDTKETIVQPRVSQNSNGDLNLWIKHTPVVITHIERSPNKTAAINPSIGAIYGPGDISIRRQEIIRLDWRDENGKKTAPPTPQEELEVLYFRPESTGKVK